MSQNDDISMILAEALTEFTNKQIPIPRAVENVTGRGNLYLQVMKTLEKECGTYLPRWEITASAQDIDDLFDRTAEAQ